MDNNYSNSASECIRLVLKENFVNDFSKKHLSWCNDMTENTIVVWVTVLDKDSCYKCCFPRCQVIVLEAWLFWGERTFKHNSVWFCPFKHNSVWFLSFYCLAGVLDLKFFLHQVANTTVASLQQLLVLPAYCLGNSGENKFYCTALQCL